MNEVGEPLAGACVFVNNNPGLFTDSTGAFTIDNLAFGDILSISYVGYKPKQIKFDGESTVLAKLNYSPLNLPPVAISVGYFQKKKSITASGSQMKVTPDMMRQANVLKIIQENVSGILTPPTSGLPGAAYRVQIRGQTSIGILPGTLSYNDPLIIIDGVPYAANYNSLQPVSRLNVMGVQGKNSYVNININDIESITILKDESGIALYGSKGTNGVVVINTKRGNPGFPAWDVKASMGVGQITVAPNLMNTQQYLAMRREAFRNDNTTPTVLTAPDLVSWDTSRYTDFRKTLFNTIFRKDNLQAAFSGGSTSTQYYLSGGYNNETTLFPSNMSFKRKTFHSHITHKSENGKLRLDAITQLGFSESNTGINNLAGYIYLPPNIQETNNKTYTIQTFSSISGIDLQYRFSPALRFSLRLGYNSISDHDLLTLPVRWQTIFTTNTSLNTDYTIRRLYNTRLAEPVLHYSNLKKQIRYTLLLGTTMQQINNRVDNIISVPLVSDPVTNNINTSHTNGYSRYNYINCFSKLGFQLNSKYLMNIILRREGSNLVRAKDRFGNFGAIGVGWVFRNDSFFKKTFPFISYGKLKGSYGISGNDQYVADNYSNGKLFPSNFLQGSAATAPAWVTAMDYSWRISRKIDMGIELEFLNDRILLNVDVYRNRTGNQIIDYPDPARGLQAKRVSNSSAIIQNKGLEITLQLKNNKLGPLKWYSSFLLTLPKNKLLSFPGLSTSTYANTLVTGRSLTVQQGYTFTGVNPSSGLFEFADLNKDGRIDRTNDFKVLGDLDPRLYGSVKLGLNYKNWDLIFFLEGSVQKGFSMLSQFYANVAPGASMVNLPIEFLDRWRKPGDQSPIQRLSANNSFDTRNAISKYIESDARLTSASYLRLRYIDLNYELPLHKKKNGSSGRLSLHLTADNLFTITKYKRADPQIQNIFTLPQQTSLTAGVRFSY